MQKHPNLTAGRIRQFVPRLEKAILGPRSALRIEFCDVAHSDEATARREGPWTPVESGFEYGPAYRVFWFRVTGEVPLEMAGHSVFASLELGSERTLWRDNSPARGIDEPHSLVKVADRAEAGQGIDWVVQAYSRNPQCRVHGRELPRETNVEKVDHAELVAVDEALKALYFDVDFAANLMGALAENEPAHAVLMRALNEVVNQWEPGSEESIQRCRKLLRDAMTNLGGELRHTLYPLGHAHLDTAWLWPIAITKLKMAHTTSTQLELLAQYPEYVFVHSQASQYEWLEQEYPVLFDRVRQAVRRGQWEPVGSMWVEADCNLTGAESLVRQFLYGRAYFRDKLGVETHDMFLPDVFGYSAALPQILSKFNIRYFLTQKISWNQLNKFPHHTFWWQGIDGSRVWAHFPPADTYGANCEPQEMLKTVRNHKDHARSDASLYLFGYGDGGGGPTERHLEFLRRARVSGSLPEVQTGRKAIDFYRESAQKGRDLLTWSGELYLEYHRGTYTSQAANKRGNRYSEFLLRDAEWLACFREDFPAGYPQAELERLWKLVLLNQFHDIIPGSSVREVYEDSDRDYAEIREKGEAIVLDSITRIASNFETEGMTQPVALFHNASVPGMVHLPWDRRDVPSAIEVGDESLPVQAVEAFGESQLIFPTPTAALGAVAVADLNGNAPAMKFRLKASNRKIENAFFAIRFDPNGNITSIEGLEDGTEFIQPGKLANLFQLFDDQPLFWSAWDVDPFLYEKGKDLIRSERFEIVERGPVRVAAEIEKRFGNSRIVQRIGLGPSQVITFDTEIDWHEEDKMLKVAFPLNVNAARATCEIQFGHVERPTHSNTSWDAAKFEVCAQKWVDVSEGDHGVALLNQGKYGHDFKGNLMRLSLLRSPKAPDPQCDMGKHRFAYALLPHYGSLNYAGVVAAAYAFNATPWAVPVPRNGGTQGVLPPFVGCEDRNLVVESVKRAEDGQGLIVRLYECHNARGRAELWCIRKPQAAWSCNLEETPETELEVNEDGVVSFAYKPFEILTLRLSV